jgi:hypothetical protein
MAVVVKEDEGDDKLENKDVDAAVTVLVPPTAHPLCPTTVPPIPTADLPRRAYCTYSASQPL